jgi:hypothetical protein
MPVCLMTALEPVLRSLVKNGRFRSGRRTPVGRADISRSQAWLMIMAVSTAKRSFAGTITMLELVPYTPSTS